MARIVISEDFYSQLQLLSSVNTENTNLGADSPITAFLTQQGIVLSDDITAGNNAQTHETNRALFSRQSENYRQLRDNNFDAPWSHLTGGTQFLKSFYKGNTKELGNWGITITDSGKINYPPAFTDRVIVFNNFVARHNGFAPGTSPLQPYLAQQNIDLTDDSGFVTTAVDSNTSFTIAAQQSENETELRNQIWNAVMEHIKAIGNFLMKLYSNNPKALGNWGFTVDDSPQKPRLRTTTLKLGEQITTNGVVLGSTLSNIGETEIHVYKGKTTVGTPNIVHAGEQFGIMKGFSSITVANPSAIKQAKFTVYIVN